MNDGQSPEVSPTTVEQKLPSMPQKSAELPTNQKRMKFLKGIFSKISSKQSIVQEKAPVAEESSQGHQDSSLTLTNQIRSRHKRTIYRNEVGRFWTYYGKSIRDYERTFEENLGGTSIEDFLADRPAQIVVDLMAPSDTLANLFTKLKHQSIFQKIPFFQKTREDKSEQKPTLGLAVALEDKRTPKQINRDSNLNIEQITGDLMESAAWRQISHRLGNRKADLILERAVGGLDAVPIHKKYYAIVLQKVWHMLNENGGMALLETPSPDTLKDFNIPIDQYVNSLKQNGINVTYVPTEAKAWGNGSLKIIRTPESPNQLPLLEQ